MPRRRSVRILWAISFPSEHSQPLPTIRTQTDPHTAKFSGYQYGGRPLGLSYVKYQTFPEAGSGDGMEGAESTAGLTQDQIM